MRAMVIGDRQRVNEKARQAMESLEGDPGRESRLAMIQMLIPLGLREVEKELKAEVRDLAGERYSRGSDGTRWGSMGI